MAETSAKEIYTDLADIKKAADAYFNDAAYQALKTRWEKDFDMYTLQPYKPGKGFQAYTSNMPRVIGDKLINLVRQARLVITVPTKDLIDASDIETANNIERLLYGIFCENDEELALSGEPILRDQKAWFATNRGSWFIRPYVFVSEDKRTTGSIDIFDPYATAYALGSRGLAWVCHKSISRKQELIASFAEYNSEAALETSSDTEDIEVYEYIDGVNWGVFAKGEWLRPLEPHGCSSIPVFRIVVGAMPSVWQTDKTDIAKYRGESIYAAIRDIIPVSNKLMSDVLTLVHRDVKKPIAIRSRGAEKTLEEDIWQSDQAHAIQLDIDEGIETVLDQKSATDMHPLLSMVAEQIQMATFPRTSFGSLDFRLSGFAIGQLQDSVITVVSDYVQAIELSYRVCCLSIIEQFANKKLPAAKVRGTNSKNQKFGFPMPVEIKPADINGEWYPEVRLEPKTLKDEAEAVVLAKQLSEGDTPLLSRKTVRETILNVEDPNAEDMRIFLEKAQESPEINWYNVYVYAMNSGLPDIANFAKINLLKIIQPQQAPGQPGQGQPKGQPAGAGQPSPSEMLGMQGVGFGMPGAPTGMPTSMLPGEAMGGTPPGAASAVPNPQESRSVI